jgi:Eco29kI restriction endonuclease
MAPDKASLKSLADQLRELTDEMVREEATQIAAPRATRVRKTIEESCDKLRKVLENLDPIKHPGFVFDPSNPNIAGRIAGITLLAHPRRPLSNIDLRYGSGIYALYYNGGFSAYAQISKREHPIYVGKADPDSLVSKTAFEQGPKLSARLKDHRRTIGKSSTTLDLADFEYRALVIKTGWQEAAESYLIDLFKPIWNKEMKICYGFGKHGDDPGTRANTRSPWDTLHQGRDWAHRDPNMIDAESPERIVERIEEHFVKYPPLGSIDEVLRRFLDEMRAAS